MDYSSEKGAWGWREDDYYLEKDTDIDMPVCVWDNGEDISFIFEETTPVKACGELARDFNDGDIMTKSPRDSKESSSQLKRRRMLAFGDGSGDMPSAFLKSKERSAEFDDLLPEVSEWEACFQVDMAPADFDDLSQSEAWLAECLNDTDINISSNDGNICVTPDVQIGSPELCGVALNSTPSKVSVRSSRNVIFKGTKSYMRAPAKPTASVIYPFDFVKPIGIHGDVTLNDINQKMRAPPPSNSNQGKEGETSGSYPTSAFSGKPIVGKTKIPTQGGEGSITITRTKG